MVFELSSPPPASPAPPQETDVSLFERLRAGIEQGQVTLALDFDRLRQGDSPVAASADANVWFIGSVAGIVLATLATGMLRAPANADLLASAGADRNAVVGQLISWLTAGWMAGVVALALAVIVHFKFARPTVIRRIERRVRTLSLKDVAEWRKLWRFGGVALRRGTNTAIPECRAPEGNWFDFARRLPRQDASA